MKKYILWIAAGLVLFLFFSRDDSTYRITNSTPKGENIICFGDSLTAGTGASAGMDYPAQLAQLIGRPVINAGIPGNTTAQALDRLEPDVLSKSPRMVLITIGGNDIKNGLSKNDVRENLITIITQIQASGALVVIGGIEIPFYDRGLHKVYQEVCKEHGAILISNVYEGIMGNPSLMSDQLHPNNDGYTVMARTFYYAIKPYL